MTIHCYIFFVFFTIFLLQNIKIEITKHRMVLIDQREGCVSFI